MLNNLKVKPRIITDNLRLFLHPNSRCVGLTRGLKVYFMLCEREGHHVKGKQSQLLHNLLTEYCGVIPPSQAFSSSMTAFSSSALRTVNSSLWQWEAPPRAWLSTDTRPLPEDQRQTPEMEKGKSSLDETLTLGQNKKPVGQCDPSLNM